MWRIEGLKLGQGELARLRRSICEFLWLDLDTFA